MAAVVTTITPGAIGRDALARVLALRPERDRLFEATILRTRAAHGLAATPTDLLSRWTSRRVDPDSAGELRYPWTISPRFIRAHPPYVGSADTWRAWRPAETEVWIRDPGTFTARLIVPLLITENVAWLAGSIDDQHVRVATEVLETVAPTIRRDLAGYVADRHAWGDTWALWCLARHPETLRRFYPFALAIADGYAARALAAGGVGLGSRYPFHDRPLVSVSAQLARGLIGLGMRPKLTADLVRYVARAEDSDGGWGDAGGPVDPLTTFVALELLGALVPPSAFDPLPAAAALARMRNADGWWRAHGPETAWLTAEIGRTLVQLDRPFSERWRWPQISVEHRDRRTGLAAYAYVDDIGRLFAEVRGLADAPVEVAFIDLAGFGAWNTTYGMRMGDEVLGAFGEGLRTVSGCQAVRDGGDEFVLIGAPTGSGLAGRLATFQGEWRERFRSRFQAVGGGSIAPVRPRILVTTVAARDLVAARDALGLEIGPFKAANPDPPETGVMARVDLRRGS